MDHLHLASCALVIGLFADICLAQPAPAPPPSNPAPAPPVAAATDSAPSSPTRATPASPASVAAPGQPTPQASISTEAEGTAVMIDQPMQGSTVSPVGPKIQAPPPSPLPSPPPIETPQEPVRAERRWVIAGEIGWNGLVGLGPTLSYNFIPELTADAGLGLAAANVKFGARARVNILRSEWTPTLSLGMLYGLGTGGKTIDVEVDDETATLKVFRSPQVQVAGGVAYTGRGGFAFLGTAGWAIDFRDNSRLVEGSKEAYDKIAWAYQGGLVLAVAFGYAF